MRAIMPCEVNPALNRAHVAGFKALSSDRGASDRGRVIGTDASRSEVMLRLQQLDNVGRMMSVG